LDDAATLQTKGILLGTIRNIQPRAVVDYLHALPLHSDIVSLWRHIVACKDRLGIPLNSVEGDVLISTLTAGRFDIMTQRDPTIR
jgi:hypothetical protein